MVKDKATKEGEAEVPRTRKHDLQSTAFIKGLFESRNSVAQEYGSAFDMPQWYHSSRPSVSTGQRYSLFLFKGEDDDDAAKRSLASLRPAEKAKENLQEKVDSVLRGCAQEAVNQVLLDGKPFESLPDAPRDPATDSDRWVCKKNDDKSQKKDLALSYRERLLKKLDEAIILLMEKFEAQGEFPQSEWQQCDPKLQYGIDVSPTISQCALSRRRQSDYVEDAPGTEERTKAYAETPTPTSPKDKSRRWREGLFCPIMDLSIEALVKEPTAESLLLRVGALNEEGELSCDLKDFNDVQHCVKKLLILWAMEVEARDAQNALSGKHEVSFQQSEKNIYTHLKKALNYDINKEHFRKQRTRTLPSLLLGTKPSGRMHKSMPPEKIEEIIQRLVQAISLEDDEEKPDLKHLKASLYEILPFEFNESFDGGDFGEDIPEEPPRKFKSLFSKKSIAKSQKISWPVESQSQEKALLDIVDCIPQADRLQAQKLNFFQWQNRRLVDEMKDLKDLSEDEQELITTVKHFSHWLDVVRKGRILKGVCSSVERTKLFEGGFPKHGLDLIRSFEQDPDYLPDSKKEYEKKLMTAREALENKIAAMLEEFPYESDE